MFQQLAPARAGSERAIPTGAPVSSAYKVDISRGERIGRVSSEWFSRPDDERYLSLSAPYDAVRSRAERATTRAVETRALRVEANRDSAERLALIVPGRDEPVAPTHWSYGQLCTLVGAPRRRAGELPPPTPGAARRHQRSKTLGMASFFLRAVCMNRNIWGAEGLEEISIRHSKFAANRFAHEAAPALENFANSSPTPFIAGIKASRERIVARKEDDREDFLRKQGFSRPETAKIISTVLQEEGRPPESIFDFVQALPPWPGPSHTRTRGWRWRARRRSCWPVSADPNQRGGGSPSPRRPGFTGQGAMRVRGP